MGVIHRKVASVALPFLSVVNASELVKRTGPAKQPSCVDFTPFVYAGCFRDDSSPRTLLYASNLDFRTMTVEKCVAFCKGNDYKYAGLEYYGECYCGASVNAIQIEEKNCNFPCNGNKTESCGGGKTISIYQDPTFPVVATTTISDYMPMGCYTEGPNGRTLGWRQDSVNPATLTVEKCLSACLAGGYAFAGVEFGRECYCGVVLGNGTLPLNAAGCDIQCTGDKTQFCGGRSKLNLYVAKNLESIEPCDEDVPIKSSSSTQSPGLSTSSIVSPSPSASSLATTVPSPTFTSLTLPPLSSSASSKSSTTSLSNSLSTTTSINSLTTSPFTMSFTGPLAGLPTPFTTPSMPQSSSSSITPISSFTTTPITTLTTITQPSSTSSSTGISSTTSSVSQTTTSSTTAVSPASTTSSSASTSSSTSLITYHPTRISTSTTQTSALCNSYITAYPPLPSPTCEYKWKWCANPIPEFSDTFTCLKAFSSCVTQLGACFTKAGYPDSLKCNQFNEYCSRIADFCDDYCPGSRCTLSGCRQAVPSYGVPPILTRISGTTYTTLYTCPAFTEPTGALISATVFTTHVITTTSSRQSQPTTVPPVPTYTNICTQANNPTNGYGPSYPVGGIPLPNLSCNNEWSDYNSGHPFKLYTSSDTYRCPSYGRTGSDGPVQGCKDACDEQFVLCNQRYAEPYGGFKRAKRGGREDYSSASRRCVNQKDDCYFTNKDASGGQRCGTFNTGY